MNNLKRIPVIFILLALLRPAVAGNIDLATLPARDAVQLTIYNSEDLTLVRETRQVSFKPGENLLQFSWANTLIDPGSVELRFPGHPGSLEVVDTVFPHARPQLLYWNIDSSLEGMATVEISYFTSGITWRADYTGIIHPQEAGMGIDGFVRVVNHSGEDYEHASVRLVVGTINLVEKIARLGRLTMPEIDDMPEQKRRELRYRAARDLLMESAVADMAAAPAERQKGIIKDGLSEYFIFSIDGTETIPNGWAKRLRSFDSTAVPGRVVYRYRRAQYGDRLVKLFLFNNDAAAGMGKAPLPQGRFKILWRHPAGGLRYLETLDLPYIPVGDEIELNLGVDEQVVFEELERRNWRDNFWMRYGRGDVYRRLTDGHLKVDHNSTVAGWDAHALRVQRIRNNTDRAVQVEVRRGYPGDVEFRGSHPVTLHDVHTVEYKVEIAPGVERDIDYRVTTRKGRNAKQHKVVVKKG